jgi:hypothetical protein
LAILWLALVGINGIPISANHANDTRRPGSSIKLSPPPSVSASYLYLAIAISHDIAGDLAGKSAGFSRWHTVVPGISIQQILV